MDMRIQSLRTLDKAKIVIMNHIDSYLIAFTDVMSDVKSSVELGNMKVRSIEKDSTLMATTAVLKAVAFTRSYDMHNDAANLSNLWTQAFDKTNDASNFQMPEDLLSKPGASDNYSIEMMGNKAFINKLIDLEMVCLELQECLFGGGGDTRRGMEG